MSRLRPHDKVFLYTLILCDNVRRSSNNKSDFLGAFVGITGTGPVSFFLVTRWYGHEPGRYPVTVRLLSPYDNREVASVSYDVIISDDKPHYQNVVQFVYPNFERAGLYSIAVELEGRIVQSLPLEVKERTAAEKLN